MNLRSERLLLRKLKMADASDMFEFTSIPEVSDYLAWEYHKSVKEDEEFIRNCLENDSDESIHIGIELIEKNKLIGCLHIYNISHKHKRAEISYILSPLFQGQGFATEAVNTLVVQLFTKGFRRVQALCILFNTKSEKLMKRCGMKKEGILENYALLNDGNSYPMVIYSICKNDKKEGEK